jgi:hypothetical protein
MSSWFLSGACSNKLHQSASKANAVRRTTAPAVLMFLCLMPRAAWAVDWFIRSTASETVELNNNLFLSPSPIGGTLGSYSTISANAEARTPTSKFDFDSFANYNKYWGPGASTLPETENLSYGFKGHYETFGKNNSDRNYLDAGFNQSSAAFALLSQLGVLTNVVGAINTFNVGGGLDRSLSALDTVSLSARSTLSSYEPPSAGTAFTDTSANVGWNHRLSSLTTITASSNAEWLAYNNAFSTNIMIQRNQAGFDTSLSPLLSFHGMWGAADVQVENTGVVTAPSASATGLIYDMLLTYKALKSTTFTLAAFQSVGPTAIGSLVKTTSVVAGAAHVINSVSSLSFSANVSQNTSTSTSQYASASVSYSRILARDWTANLSYRYLHSFGTTGGTAVVAPVIGGIPVISGLGAASSNSLVVVISKSITVLPHTD